MAFGGGFGGFGSTNNNNNNNSSGFGGFGSSNTTSGFGAQPQQNQQSTGFGNNAGSGLFGSGGAGFGSNTSGFGAAKPFGSTPSSSGGGLFGSTPATAGGTGFGGFGNTSSNTTFGSNNTGGGLFGNSANKTGFGTGTTGGGLFGSSNTGGGFGSGTTNANTGSGLFGGSTGTGLGGNVGECQGTGGTPFQPYTEKEGNTTVMNHYQAISFMQPYQKFSFDELRLADYNQGRRFGNANGQAGAFGAGTGFGAFGANNNTTNNNTTSTGTGFGGTSGGLFGGSATTSSGTGFGSNTATTGGFGGGLFGQNKPAGGLFGSSAATTAPTTGGLFGTSGSNAFGSNTNTGFGGNTGSSLFGNNAQQKPAGGFAFGANTSNATNATNNTGFGGGFGSNTNNNAGNSLFGNNTQQQGAGSSLFGNNNQQSAGGGLFGAANNTATSSFGGFGQNNQQKPGGLFGSNTSSAGGNLFGNANSQQQPQQQAGGLFGTNTQSNTGLFGAKPAQPGTGLFGNNNNNASGGIFGNNNNAQQQNNTGGIFGNASNSSSLFGAKPNTGTGLFGGNNAQAPGGSLFGANTGGSLFNNSQNNGSVMSTGQPNILQAPQGLSTSILDANPYGNASIFSGLPAPSPQATGPIATPISSGQKQKKPAALPQYKLNPAMSSRFSTPQKRGYGFSYSTYGTPSSISSAASTPGGMSSSLLGGSLSRSLGKSFSTSNLRRTFDSDADSILTPGAFSASSSKYGNGSLKKLNIDRTLRTDLFGDAVAALPPPERHEASRSPSVKKKVSFDASTTGGNESSRPGHTEGGFVDAAESVTPEVSTPRTKPLNGLNVSRPSNGVGSPEKNNQLMTVHEDGSPQANNNNNALIVHDQSDPELGDYWCEPSISDLKKMSREQLKNVEHFQVGRTNAGSVTFDEPVDLTTVNLDDIFDKIVVIVLRSLTVYPANVSKPPLGKGLNVPSTITLENSWPKQRDRKTPSSEKSGPRFEKHVKRLAAVRDTKFVNYNADTGEWTFKVPHFTTYGLDYDDDDTTEHSEMEGLASSMLSEAKSMPTPTPVRERYTPQAHHDHGYDSSEADDTFGYKKRSILPGAFDEDIEIGDEPPMSEMQHDQQSFLGVRSAVSHHFDEDDQDEPSEHQDLVIDDHSLLIAGDAEDELADMAGTYPGIADGMDATTKSEMMRYQGTGSTPSKALIDLDMDWVDQLRRTVSPKKQDRQALRHEQDLLFSEAQSRPRPKTTGAVRLDENEIHTSLDLMNSLFGSEELRKSRSANGRANATNATKVSNQKPPENSLNTINENDRAFHNSFKPSWSAGQRLTYLAQTSGTNVNRDIRTMKFARTRDINAANFNRQREQTEIVMEGDVPRANGKVDAFGSIRSHAASNQAHADECLAWGLASILLDDYEDDFSASLDDTQISQLRERIRKDRLALYWVDVCEERAMTDVAAAGTAEERAIAYLSANKVPNACNTLMEAKLHRLATLIAQIGGDQTMQEDMATQIEDWRKLNVLSEMSDPIRALYELLAGNTGTSIGKRGPVEDRAQNFIIPERFNLDWRRAFGLKLWYAIEAAAPLETAVTSFTEDLRETDMRRPLPYFHANPIPDMPWEDPTPGLREDILWGLLRIYSQRSAAGELTEPRALAEVVRPENVVGLPFSYRLTFELYRALAPHFSRLTSDDAFDEIIVSFATELESVDQWLWALFVLLHLSQKETRSAALQDLLARNARSLHDDDHKLWTTLTRDFSIPESWLWEAKALYVRSSTRQHSGREIEFLLRAGNMEEAHRKLVESVAPSKVVTRDFDGLRNLLAAFYGQTGRPSKWAEGGGLYEDYLKLVGGSTEAKERRSLVDSLLRRLAAADGGSKKRKGSKNETSNFLRTVAIREMSGVVGDAALDIPDLGSKEQAWILQLPLAVETRRSKAMGLGWNYYQSVMAAGN